MIIGAAGVYLLEVSMLLTLLFILNNFLLGRETFHRLNRFVWLFSLILSFLAPFIAKSSIALREIYMVAAKAGALEALLFDVEVDSTSAQAVGLSVLEVAVNTLFWIYIIGVAALALYNIVVYLSLMRLIFTSRYNIQDSRAEDDKALRRLFIDCEDRIAISRDVHYVVHDRSLAPFSWLNFVVVSRSDLSLNGREVIMHELSHVKQRHSVDIILVNLATIALWFNPIVWLVKRAMQQVHEYCADSAVLSKGVNAKEYQLLLITKAAKTHLNLVSSNLSHSGLKERMVMMLQRKSPRIAAAKSLYIIPIFIFAVLLFASPAVNDSTDKIARVELITPELDAAPVNSLVNSVFVAKGGSGAAEDPSSIVYVRTEKLPSFEGGDLLSFRSWVVSQLRYPYEAIECGVEGTVFVKFIVDADGSISRDVEELKSPDSALTDEVKRVLAKSPKWSPGEQDNQPVRVSFVLPVVFAIDNSPQDNKLARLCLPQELRYVL